MPSEMDEVMWTLCSTATIESANVVAPSAVNWMCLPATAHLTEVQIQLREWLFDNVPICTVLSPRSF